MSRGPYPLMLILAMGLPSAARAIGLGDIHIESALNEPLSAQIDIIGASRDELIALTANVASQEIFRRYGLDRPAFLSSATFQVGIDAGGKPVLKVQSSKPFTDPLVGFVVDLHWDKGELIREYSLLLDPADISPPRPVAPTAAAPSEAPAPAAPAPAAPAMNPAQSKDGTASIGEHYRVAARETLRGITRRIRPGPESHTQRMMIAIFRSNPHAFEGNINLLLRGALLRIPSEAEAASVGGAEAKREVRAQMTAWRLDGRPQARQKAAANSVTVNPDAGSASAPASNAAAAAQSVDAPSTEMLKSRVQSLEQALGDVRKQIANETAEMDDMKQLAATPPRSAPPAAADASSRFSLPGNKVLLGALAAALALLLAGFAFARRRLLPTRARPAVAPIVDPHFDALIAGKAAAPAPVLPAAAPVPAVADQPRAAAPPEPREPAIIEPAGCDQADDNTQIDIDALEQSYLAMDKSAFVKPAAVDQETAIMDQDTAIMDANTPTTPPVNRTALDYNLHDLDATAQHVQVSGQLDDAPVVVERRKNVADVLKSAIDRDPGRRDLRMKLLETYYSAASTNQRAFLEAVRQLSRQRELLSEDDWNRVTMMGRTIAPDDILFADQSTDDELADCA